MKTSGLCALAAMMSGLSPTFADNVGTAISIKTQVAAEQPGEVRVLIAGAAVAQDETIRTDESGNAQLEFVDETLLTIGPSSSIKLDKLLFAPDRKAKTFVLEAMIGAFRFVSGKSNHKAYEIRTPVATIGVRGTRFAFGIRGDEVTIVITQGLVTSCTRVTAAAAARCVNAAAGNTIVSTPAGAVVRRTLSAIPDVLRAVMAQPVPNRQLPDLRDAMRGVGPLDRPVQGLGGTLPSVNPTTSVPSAPNLRGGLPDPGGALPSPSGLPSIGGIPGGAVPRLPGIGR